MAQVSHSMAVAAHYHSDQSEVWADIAEKSVRMKASSPTGAMDALFVDNTGFIDECVASLGASERQVGALFAIGGRVLGFDLFEAEMTLRKLLPKLVRAAAIDALDEAFADPNAGGMREETFVQYAGEAAVQATAAIGMGTDLRLTAQGLTGAALTVEGRVVHLSAFALS
jgi:hypothetical protein